MRSQICQPNSVPQPKNAYEWRVFLFSHLDRPVPWNWNSDSRNHWNSDSRNQRKNKWRR